MKNPNRGWTRIDADKSHLDLWALRSLRLRFLASIRGRFLFREDSRISLPDTELAEDPAQKIFRIMPPDYVANGIECTSELDRNQLG
jgi:hypothetical protein